MILLDAEQSSYSEASPNSRIPDFLDDNSCCYNGMKVGSRVDHAMKYTSKKTPVEEAGDSRDKSSSESNLPDCSLLNPCWREPMGSDTTGICSVYTQLGLLDSNSNSNSNCACVLQVLSVGLSRCGTWQLDLDFFTVIAPAAQVLNSFPADSHRFYRLLALLQCVDPILSGRDTV